MASNFCIVKMMADVHHENKTTKVVLQPPCQQNTVWARQVVIVPKMDFYVWHQFLATSSQTHA